jgi:hypothetical protein
MTFLLSHGAARGAVISYGSGNDTAERARQI